MDNPAPAPTDRQLIRSTAGGSEADFAALYDRYSTPLYTYLVRLTKERSVAEELLQEVFLAVWQGAGRFDGRSKVSTWLYRIAHHKAVDWLRRHRPLRLQEAEQLPAGEGPEEAAFGAWRAGRLREALDELSPDHRAVLELTFFAGLSYREIARVVGCPVGTVKSRMSYARRYLKEILERMGLEG